MYTNGISTNCNGTAVAVHAKGSKIFIITDPLVQKNHFFWRVKTFNVSLVHATIAEYVLINMNKGENMHENKLKTRRTYHNAVVLGRGKLFHIINIVKGSVEIHQ